MTLISQLKERYKGWKERRFLETYGCKTWKEYERKFDPDFGPMASRVSGIYHGYDYVWQYPYPDQTYHGAGFWSYEQCQEIIKWCEDNCRSKWRNDWLRVLYDSFSGEWEINGISGSDYVFFAFKDERDYLMLLLKWS